MTKITVTDTEYKITVAETNQTVEVTAGDEIKVFVDTFTISTAVNNTGTGAAVGKSITGDTLNLRKLKNTDTDIVITENTDDITVNLAPFITADLTGDVTGQVSDLSNHTTTNLTEGDNLYYTQARFDTAFAAKDTGDLTEGSNLYYTAERVDDQVNTLLQAGSGIALDYDDANGELMITSDYMSEIVKNATGSTIPKGTPVFVTGIAGDKPTVEAADASDAAKMPAIGILNEAIAPDAEGDMLIMGRISGVDTSAFSEGDTIYVAAGGGYTNTKPSSVDHLIQNLGFVTKVHATNGGGIVYGSGRSNAVPNRFSVAEATVTDLDAQNISYSGNITVTTNTPGNYVNIDTDNLYVGTTAQAVQITDTEVTALGSTPITFTGEFAGDLTGNVSGGTTVSATTISGTTVSATNLSGELTGDVKGDIYSQDGSTKIFENGTNGSDATFTGSVTGTVSSIANHTTDDLTEGTTNQFHTTARVQSVIDTNTAGFITDYTVTQADVTQHQAALSIQESQITGLDYYTNTDWDTQFATKTTDDLTEGTTNLFLNDTTFNSKFDTRLGTKTTDDITEGTTNQFFTTTNFNTEFATKTTDDLTEGTTNTFYSDAQVDSHLTGGTGVDYTSGTISIGQPVGTTDTVTFADINATDIYAETLAYDCKNVSGGTLQAGDPVYIHSFSSSRIQVDDLVKGNTYTDGRPKIAWGIAGETIANNAVGKIIRSGRLNGLNTNGLTEGRALYLAASGATQPWETHPGYGDDLQQIGFCVQEDATNGIIWVNIQDPVSHTATLQGDIEINGHFLPSANVAHDLGSTTRAWRDIYVGPGSLYVDGQKIVSSDEGTIDITTDSGQNLNIQAGGSLTLLSSGANTNLTDATLNLGPTGNDGTINIRGTLESPDTHIGDLELSATLIDQTTTNQNLEIRTNGTGYLHANVADLYVGPISGALKLDENSLEVIGGDTLTVRDNLTVNEVLKVDDGLTLGQFNPYGMGTNMPTNISGIGQEDGWAGLHIRNRGEHDFGLGFGNFNPRALVALGAGRKDGSSDDYLNSGDDFAYIMATPYSGYKTGAEWLTPSASILAQATENHSASGMGTKLIFQTTENGNSAGAQAGSHTNADITFQGTKITSSGTLTLDDSVNITGLTNVQSDLDVDGNLILNGELTNNGAGLTIVEQTTFEGSNANKTVIGDETLGSGYDAHGIKVFADDNRWGAITIQEYVGGANKPLASGFANPSFGTEVIGGTPTAKSNVVSGKRLFLLQGVAANATDGSLPVSSNFVIKAETTEDQTATNRGAKVTIETMANGATQRTTTAQFQDNKITINPDGIGQLGAGSKIQLTSALDTNNSDIRNDAGDVKIADNLVVTDNTTLQGDLTVTQAAVFNGNVTLGNANTDSITANGPITCVNGLVLTSMNTSTANYLAGVLGIIDEGAIAYITDGDAGNKCIAVYDGSNWKRISFGANISSS